MCVVLCVCDDTQLLSLIKITGKSHPYLLHLSPATLYTKIIDTMTATFALSAYPSLAPESLTSFGRQMHVDVHVLERCCRSGRASGLSVSPVPQPEKLPKTSKFRAILSRNLGVKRPINSVSQYLHIQALWLWPRDGRLSACV